MIQLLRLLLLPFPMAVLLGSTALVITDQIMRPDRTGIDDSVDAGSLVGLIVIFSLVGSLQLFLGVPSLLILDAKKSRRRGYMITALLVAITLSFSMSKVLIAPQLGETMRWVYPWVFAFWGVPIMLSYWLAFSTRTIREA